MERPEINEKMLSDIKKSLRVTHKYLDTDIEDIIIDGMAEIESFAGKFDYESYSISSRKAYKLLKVYCYYAWNDLVPDFQTDNRKDIISLQTCVIQYGR